MTVQPCWRDVETLSSLISTTFLPTSNRAIVVNETSWPAIITLASAHLVAPLMHSRLKLTGMLPADVAAYFEAAHELNVARNARLGVALVEAVPAFVEAGLRPILLKGAATLFDGLYSSPGARMMSDLDVLFITQSERSHAAAILRNLGYLPADEGKIYPTPLPFDRGNSPPPMRHAPAMGNTERGVWFEIHDHVFDGIARDAGVLDELNRDAVGIAVGKTEARVLSGSHRILHAVLHAQISNNGYKSCLLDLRQLAEVRALAERFGPQAISEALSVASRFGYEKEFTSYFDLLDELFPITTQRPTSEKKFPRCVRQRYGSVWRRLAQSAYLRLQSIGIPCREGWPRLFAEPAYFSNRIRQRPWLLLNLFNKHAWRRIMRRW